MLKSKISKEFSIKTIDCIVYLSNCSPNWSVWTLKHHNKLGMKANWVFYILEYLEALYILMCQIKNDQVRWQEWNSLVITQTPKATSYTI